MLTAFGLPEPPSDAEAQPQSLWYRWFLIGAFFCLLLALVLWRVGSYYRSSAKVNR